VTAGQNDPKAGNFIMPGITPCLWFDTQALEAAEFYVSIFKNSRLGKVSYYGEGAPLAKGTVLTVTFQLNGQEFMALNGGPVFQFNEAMSLVVNCETQDEIDEYWQKLTAGGQEVQCGWLKDKFGLSWQIVPTALGKMLTDKDPAKSNRMMQVLMQMVKLDIRRLEQAFRGE
jgi:predicted 3-demethylubiquinone-9 3-methyltransferase (glyoxalase superfamily)